MMMSDLSQFSCRQFLCIHFFYFCETVAECGEGSVGDGFGGDVKLDVVGVAVKLESIMMDDFAKGEHVEDEEEGTKYRSLGDAL